MFHSLFQAFRLWDGAKRREHKKQRRGRVGGSFALTPYPPTTVFTLSLPLSSSFPARFKAALHTLNAWKRLYVS